MVGWMGTDSWLGMLHPGWAQNHPYYSGQLRAWDCLRNAGISTDKGCGNSWWGRNFVSGTLVIIFEVWKYTKKLFVCRRGQLLLEKCILLWWESSVASTTLQCHSVITCGKGPCRWKKQIWVCQDQSSFLFGQVQKIVLTLWNKVWVKARLTKSLLPDRL